MTGCAPFVHRLRVRYHECDAQQRVFNAHYFTYFDLTLTELWREAFGSYSDMVRSGYDVVVAEATARFRGAARFDEEVDVAMTIVRLGDTSMTTDVEVRRDGEVLVEGRMVHVWVDAESFEKRSIPDEARERLAPYAA
ncbi:MAG: acyl-CoA thioester hydrolase [Solirubrobacteraceae bacterium]|nr:acyl-CoA thioester hydrolase [Solirubrobacteraceae bacterium]